MMKQNVLLFNPPIYYSKGHPHVLDVSAPPLGVIYIASYINYHSKYFNAKVYDIGAESLTLNKTLEIIDNEKPFAIGVTSMTPQLQGCVELSRIIKQKYPEIPIFLGGPHISGDSDFINRNNGFFDYAITGESEKTFLESINKLMKKEPVSRIQNGEIIEDLDTIPFPDKNLVNRNEYSRRESMLFSRGCPYDCYYCSRPAVSKKIRYRTAANVVEEIKRVYGFCDGRIDFQDDTFTLNRKKVLELCEEIHKASLKLEWHCNTRIDLVDEELLHSMKNAGCSLIHFGIESGNEKLRKNQIHKGTFTNGDITRVFNLCRKYGIKIGGYFMIGHPGETKESLKETRKMILDSKIDLMGLSIPTPFPGSELYDIAEKEGTINTKIIDEFAEKKLGEGYSGIYPVYVPEGIDRKYLFQEMKNINRRFYFNFRILSARLMQDVKSPNRFKSDIIDFVFMLTQGTSSRKPYKNKIRTK